MAKAPMCFLRGGMAVMLATKAIRELAVSIVGYALVEGAVVLQNARNRWSQHREWMDEQERDREKDGEVLFDAGRN